MEDVTNEILEEASPAERAFLETIADQCRSGNIGYCGVCNLVGYCEDKEKQHFFNSKGGVLLVRC